MLSTSESLTDQDLHGEETVEILGELEARGLIELVYEEEDDAVYRFESTFLRETLFQMQMFEGQRRVTHWKVIAYLQDNIVYNWQTDVSGMCCSDQCSGILRRNILCSCSICCSIIVWTRRKICHLKQDRH